jgi:hypothetical protein
VSDAGVEVVVSEGHWFRHSEMVDAVVQDVQEVEGRIWLLTRRCGPNSDLIFPCQRTFFIFADVCMPCINAPKTLLPVCNNG